MAVAVPVDQVDPDDACDARVQSSGVSSRGEKTGSDTGSDPKTGGGTSPRGGPVKLAERFGEPTRGTDFESTCDSYLQLVSLKHSVSFTQLCYVSSLVEDQQVDCGGNEEAARYYVSEFLHFKCGDTWHEAKEMVRVAIACRDLPVTTQAYAGCVFGWKYLALLTRFLTPETEREFLEHLGSYSIKALRRKAREAEVNKRDQKASEAPNTLLFSSNDERGFIKGDFDLGTFAKIRDAVDCDADSEGKDPETGLYRPQDERRADAFAAIAGAVVSQDADPERASVSIHIDLNAFLTGQGIASVDEFTVPVKAIRDQLCDSRYQFIWEQEGRPIGIGRTRREIPKWLRILLRHRDMGCRFPGCDASKGIEAHHILWWRYFGETNIDNLVCLCRRHHRLIHNGGWLIAGDPNFVVDFVSPDGNTYTGAPPPLQPGVRGVINGMLATDDPERHRSRQEQLRLALLTDPDPPPGIRAWGPTAKSRE